MAAWATALLLILNCWAIRKCFKIRDNRYKGLISKENLSIIKFATGRGRRILRGH